MSAALTAVMRTGGQQPPETLLARLVGAVDQVPEATGEWSGLTVRTPGRVYQHRGAGDRLTGEEVRRLLPGLAERERARRLPIEPGQVKRAAAVPVPGAPALRVEVRTSWSCWRYPGKPDSQRGQVGLHLASWDAAAAREPAIGSDEREDGSAWLTVGRAGPFYTGGGGAGDLYRAQVAENAGALLRLVDALITGTEPVSARLHTDAGPPLPFNAHLAYYADVTACLADVDWIGKLWREGSARRQLAPLQGATTQQLSWSLHEWRPASRRERLREDLSRLVATRPMVGRPQIEGVLAAGTCPARRFGAGFAILGAAPPGCGFIDGFIDPFYTELAILAGSGDAAPREETAGGN